MPEAIERIYADHAATTPARPEVVEAMLPYFGHGGYNPSSLHAEGRRARSALDDARERVARLLGARAKEIVFTGSGSEADNLAILGVARARREHGRHIVSTAIEHHAVLHSLDSLRDEGFDVTFVPPGEDGAIATEAFERALRADTTLASIMWANNELGTLQPVRQLAAVARRRGVVFHTDAVQLPAYARIDVDDAGVDLLSISAHKFYGPKGVGALYVRSGTPLLPLVLGGSQEFAKRAGTENVAGIVGMAVALELATAELPQSAQRIGGLRDRFEATIVERISGIRINGRAASRLPNVSNVSIDGIEGEALVVRLDLEGVAVSSGSACASGSLEPSHVIAALGLDPRWQRGVVRFSFGRTTTDSQVDRLVDVLDSAVARLRAVNSSAVDV